MAPNQNDANTQRVGNTGSQSAAQNQTPTQENQSTPQGVSSTPAASCTSPEQVFGVAAAMALLLRKNLTTLQIQTLINLLTLLVSNLSTFIIQQQLCEGVIVQPPDY